MEKVRISILITLFFTASYCFGNPNQSNQYFIQFRIIAVTDVKAAEMIDNKMRTKSGVVESRTDHVTSTYFCLLSPGTDYNKENFISWFSKLGYTIACFSKGIQNVDVMISPHVLKNCVDQQ